VFAPDETGGDDVISYELWRDEGLINSAFSSIQSFAAAGGSAANLLEHTVSVAQDGLIIGRIYTFKFRTANTVGWSEWTDVLRVGLADRVKSPANLRADLELTTATSVSLEWDMVLDAHIVTQGYFVEMLLDDDIWSEVFTARHDPNSLKATVYGLKPAKLFKFRVFAVDFNG